MKKYNDMLSWLKQKGILYFQDCNICISGKKDGIYSCNNSYQYYGKGKNNVLKTNKNQYKFKSLILWTFVPRSFGNQIYL